MDFDKLMEGIYDIQKTVNSMDNRLTSVENRLDSMEKRLDSVEHNMLILHDDHSRFEDKQDFLQQQVDTFIKRTVDNATDIRALKRVLNN